MDAIEPQPAPLLGKIAFSLLAVLSFGLPLAFGGVHPEVYQPASIVILLTLTLYLVFAPNELAVAFASNSLSRRLLQALLLVFLYIIFQFALFNLQTKPHPVLGVTSTIVATSSFRSSLLLYVFFLTSFVLVRAWLGSNERRFKILIKMVMAVGLAVSLTGLSHWFYDNGKLFWTFSPENIFISYRARWPFVNANHLGHFLLPVLFVLLAQALIHIQALRRYGRDGKNKNKALSRLVSNERLQSKAIGLAWTVSLILGAMLCILGTLSRSSWLGLSIATAIFAGINWKKIVAVGESPGSTAGTAPLEREEVIEVSSHRRARHRRHEHRGPAFSTSLFISRSLPALFLICVGVLLFLLVSGKGAELFAERLDYGLMHSKDDLRFQLYSDTMPMIASHPLWGVGLGGWERSFYRYMDNQLSGLRPVYLHSDPIQLVAELGIAGSALVAVLFVTLVVKLLVALKKLRGPERVLLSGILSGGLALVVASCLDFPFRIPAIDFFSALYLALAAALYDRSSPLAPNNGTGAF